MGRNDDIITALVEERDADLAMKRLLARYTDHVTQAVGIYNLHQRIKKAVIEDERNRNDTYYDRIRRLIKDPEASREDRARLVHLRGQPLVRQYRVTTDRRPYLKNPLLDAKLKMIMPVFTEFYDFNLPRDICIKKAESDKERQVLAQTHQAAPRESYHVSNSDLHDMLKMAKAELENPTKLHATINAFQLVTGRRNYEVLSTLQLQPVPDRPLQATVTGIAKNDIQFNNPRVIPILHTYPVVESALNFIRAELSARKPCDDMVGLNSRHSKAICDASERLFGRRLTHTQKRSLYLELAYANRMANRYLVGDESVARNLWMKRALCHGGDLVTDVSTWYQNMLVEDNQ